MFSRPRELRMRRCTTLLAVVALAVFAQASDWPGASLHQVHVPLVPIVAVGAAPEYKDNASAACSWPQCGLLDRASSLLLRGDASRDSSVVLFFSGGS